MSRDLVIDVHTHMYGDAWMELMRRHGAPDYTVIPVANGREAIMRGDAVTAVPTPGHFDYDLRVRDMDAAGVDIAVVSLTCPNVYWGTEEISTRAAVVANDDMVAGQARHPDRIRWFASLPWEHPDAALAELRRAHANGAVGVMVLANIAGRHLCDPGFAPVWAAIDELELPVLVHPTNPPGVEHLDVGAYDLAWSVAFIFDTTLAIARMIYDGFFDRYPRLKVIASHGGAALPYLVGRFDKGYEVSTLEDQVIRKPPSEYLRSSIFYDCITYDAGALRHCVDVVGSSQMLFGSDYPHIVGDMAGMLANVDTLAPAERTALKSGNAQRILRL